jgi:membrane associated rhomboid family serine protease
MPVYRHLSIWGLIFAAGLLFAGEQIRDTSFSNAGGMVPTRVRAAGAALVAGHAGWEEAKTFSTLVTSIFLHGDATHILFNMVFLWTFGILTSDLLGQWRTLAVFVVCGICGAIVHILLNPDSSAPMIGASGAIAGLTGVYLGLALRWRLPDAEVWPLAYAIPAMQLGLLGVFGFILDLILFAKRDGHIAYGAHLGGFLSGVAIAAVITTIYPTLHKYQLASRKDCI